MKEQIESFALDLGDYKNRIQIEREEMADILAKNFEVNGERHDASDFEWAAHQLLMAGYRKQSEKYLIKENGDILPLTHHSEWISVDDDLPNEGEDLLIWIGSAKSARIRKGITEEERQKMRNGELPNPKDVYWCISQGDTLIERSKIYTSADVHGNNLVPYCWELDGGNTLFGQYVKYWKHQPQPPKMKGGEE